MNTNYLLLGAVFLAAGAVFCFATAILSKILAPRLTLEARLKAMRLEAGVPGEPEKKPRERRKKENKANAAWFTKLQKFSRRLEDELYDIGIRMTGTRFLILWFCATLGLPMIAILLGLSGLIAVLIACVCAMLPLLYVKMKRSSRRTKLEAQLVDAITILVSGLRAGHSFQSAMNSIVTEMEAPISEEFGRVFREQLHGLDMAASMDRMNERVGSPDLEMLCTAILIQRDIGGNLAEILENISGTIQSRLQLKKDIKTRTASGRLSGYVIGALPILLLVALSLINPDYSSMFFQTQIGHILLIVSGVLEVIGFLVIRKIVNVKY